MKLSPIVQHLRDKVPLFDRRVAGGIDWDSLEDSGKLRVPAAYVVVGDDDAGPNLSQSLSMQAVEDQFDVVVVLEAPVPTNLERADQLHEVRRVLALALVGWKPEPHYEPVIYQGGQLVLINRDRIVYRYSFSSEWQLGRSRPEDPPETWCEAEVDGFPRLEGITFRVDAIDPMVDKNLKYPGPDGRIESTLKLEFPSE